MEKSLKREPFLYKEYQESEMPKDKLKKGYDFRHSVFLYIDDLISRFKEIGKLRRAETYQSAKNSFRRFREDRDISFEALTCEEIERYDAWLRGKGLSINTISFYMRILRAIYNRAADEELFEPKRIFRRVYTGIGKTCKRALPMSEIQKIKNLDLRQKPSQEFARDMFILSFMLRGMSFIDMTFLKKSDRKGAHISYCRRKTGQRLIIEWTEAMQKIIDKYPVNESEYLLPIIRYKNCDERSIYINTGYNINHNLRSISRKVGLPQPLTMYVARHSWASAARSEGIPVSVISECMGHDSESTTQIYLASLDTSIIDDANRKILLRLR